MSKELKPQIRFKGFEDDWQYSPFSEIATRTSHIAFDESIPCVEYEDINSKKGTLNKDITKKEIHKKGQYFIPGDLLFGKLRPYLGNNLLAYFSGIAVGDFWILKNGLASTKFLYSFLYTKDFQFVSNQSTGSKMPRADWNLVSKWEFIYPSNNLEQTYIGDFFSDVDVLISESEREIGRLEKIKQASLQKMFPRPGTSTPEIRFAGFTEPWTVGKLSEILEIDDTRNSNNKYGREDVLSVSGDYGLVNQIEFQGRSFAGASLIGYKITKPGQVIYTKSPLKAQPFGIVKSNQYGVGIISPLYAVYNPKEDNVSDFVHYYFAPVAKLNNYLRPLINKGAKNTILISDETAMDGDIVYPSGKEQKFIADYFLKLDKLLESKRQKLAKLRQIKQACLDKMFVNSTEL